MSSRRREEARRGFRAIRPRVERPPGTDPDGILLTFPVAPEHAGQRLDRFIQSRIPRLSRTRAQRIVQSCAFAADGRRRRAAERVREGEIVMLVRPRFEEPDAPRTFGVLYEDESLLAVDKPAGLPMHPSASYHHNTLTALLAERYGDPTPQIAHRLDRETSGVVVCAKHLHAERELKRAFEERRVQKRYLAIVSGRLPEERGTIDLPLGRAREGLHLVMEVRSDGADARTSYEVLDQRGAFSLVALFPHTGRQHQLRVHLAALGTPIVGDKLYGPEGVSAFMDYIDRGMELDEDLLGRLGHPRQALHAADLWIAHPDDGETCHLASPLPDDLNGLWERA